MDRFISMISVHLFWDTNPDELDPLRHVRYIVQQILTRGNLPDFKLMNEFYCRKTLVTEIKEMKKLNNKNANLVHKFYSIPKNKMRCYEKRQFQLKHWNY